jgi:hypothetical protein
MMWLYWKLVPIEEAREHAKRIMKGFDELPRKERDKQNYSGRCLDPSDRRAKSVK